VLITHLLKLDIYLIKLMVLNFIRALLKTLWHAFEISNNHWMQKSFYMDGHTHTHICIGWDSDRERERGCHEIQLELHLRFSGQRTDVPVINFQMRCVSSMAGQLLCVV